MSNRTWQLRSEGNGSTSGTPGSPNIIVHFTFYESEPGSIYFYVEKHNRTAGLSGVYTSSTLVQSIALPTSTTAASSWKVTSTGTNTCTVTSLGTGSLTGSLPSVLYDRSTNPITYTAGMVATSNDEGTTVPNQDDSFIPLHIPWTITFLGTNYTSGNVFLGSNTYLTFGSGSTEYSSLSESKPALPKLMIGSGDNSIQKVFATSGAVAVPPSLGNFDMTRTFGDSAFTITQPSSASSGAFTYSVIAGTSVISMSGTTITIASAGTATVQASQAASGNYTAATKNATITINQATSTLLASQNIFYQKFVSGASISFNVISSNAGTVSRTHESSNTSIFSIPTASNPSGTIVAPGKIYIKVIQPATTNYTAVTTDQLIAIVIVGNGITYSSETFPSSFDLAGTNLSGSVFNSCNLTGADLFNTTVNASTSFSTSTLNSLKSGRITGVTSLLPAGYIMI
jgi:hypothetical protein